MNDTNMKLLQLLPGEPTSPQQTQELENIYYYKPNDLSHRYFASEWLYYSLLPKTLVSLAPPLLPSRSH